MNRYFFLWSIPLFTVISTTLGCNLASLIPIPPVDLDLTAAGASTFQVTGGVPDQKQARFSGPDIPFDLGGGAIRISPSVITVTPTAMGKGVLAVQSVDVVPACLEACNLAGEDAATCSLVCEGGELVVTIWVGPFADIQADCTSGDRYEFTVTLDDQLQPTSVSVTPEDLLPSTLVLLTSGGEIGLCIQVLLPVDGTVEITTVTLNLRL